MNSTTKIGSMFLLAAVLVAGTISMIIPASFAEPEYKEYKDPYAKDYNSYADPYEKKYPYEPEYYVEDKKYPYGKDHDKYYKGASIQTIKCVNSNVNINGVDVNEVPDENGATGAALQAENGATNGNGNGNGLFDNGLNIDRNLVNICVNVNLNGQAVLDELL